MLSLTEAKGYMVKIMHCESNPFHKTIILPSKSSSQLPHPLLEESFPTLQWYSKNCVYEIPFSVEQIIWYEELLTVARLSFSCL